MKQNKFYLLAGTLGLILTTLSVSTIASAYQGKVQVPGRGINQEQFQAMQANRESVEAAITSRDYQAWKNIIDSRPRITDYITADNFDKFAQMHELMQNGQFEEAQKIKAELGLPDNLGAMGGFGPGHGMGRGARMGAQASNESE